MGGSWANRGLLCKVYKCSDVDNTYTAKDAQFSIPGNSDKPGIQEGYKPSQAPLARPERPFEWPQYDGEIPEGYEWNWQNNTFYQKGTNFKLDPSGWLINPRTKGYHDAYTGWVYVAGEELLMDEATGKKYTMDRVEVPFLAGVRGYPGQENPPFEVPEHLRWNVEAGYAMLPDKPYVYDPNSGWMLDPETGAYHDAYYGYKYVAETNTLLDENTGTSYTMDYQPVVE
jgi:hypothetical protein